MGCDIHAYTEFEYAPGEWEALALPDSNLLHSNTVDADLDYELFIWRNYGLFGRLAGVRSDAKMIDGVVMGLPSNTSKIVRDADAYWGVDGHSHHHIKLKYLIKQIRVISSASSSLDAYIDALAGLDPSGERIRIVYWFDS
jgi:hypothetical protein